MNTTRALWVVLAVAAAMDAGCKNSKYCDNSTNPCTSSSMTCDATHACVPKDGGMGGMGGMGGKTDGGGGGGGDGGHPFRCDASSQCAERDGGGPICEIDGASCVPCVKDTDCPMANPICANNKCRGCMLGTTECRPSYSTTPVCASTGKCVECLSKSDCVAPKAACDTSVNKCVGCVATADCLGTTPICNLQAQTCRACQADSECPSDPGVCMSHLDGHCATPAETIYVQRNSACSDTAGTNGAPFCSMQPVPAALSSTVDLVVVRGTVQAGTWTFMGQGATETSIVGQQSAFIAAGASPAFSTQSGSIYLRGLKFTSSSSVGINATGGRLRMDRCSVLSNASGGIATLNAAFDIVNTVVASNMGGLAVSLGTYSGTGPTHFAFNTAVNNVGVGVFCGQTYTMTGLLVNGNQVSNISPMCVVDSTTSTDAPLFDSARPYHLTPASPCVDKGGTTGFPTDDIDGDTRPQGSAADCGADEYKPQ